MDTLWTHQQETLDRIGREPVNLIAWEMGTGKTLYALHRDLLLRSDGAVLRTLIVAPLGTHLGWERAIQKLDPEAKINRINPKNRVNITPKIRNEFVAAVDDADYSIVHYEAVRSKELIKIIGKYDHGVFDECHRIKGRKTKSAIACKALKIPILTDMSGSPITNNLPDLWSILNHLQPRQYTSYWSFFHRMTISEKPIITTPEGKIKEANFWVTEGPSDEWMKEGLDKIKPFYDRRTAASCPDLHYARQPSVNTRIDVVLPPAMRKAYDEMNEDMITWIKDECGEEVPLMSPVFISKLGRLIQLATATLKLVDGKVQMVEPAPKLEAFLETCLDTDEQILLFSPWKSPLTLFKSMADKKSVPVSMYTGSEDGAARERSYQDFIKGNSQVLAATVGAGGEGIDGFQHVCRTVAFINRAWSPAVNDQAVARVKRAGQKRTVHILDIHALNTYDIERAGKIGNKKVQILRSLGDTTV